MTTYRVTIDIDHDRLRTYKVTAATPAEAEQAALAFLPLTACAQDDADEFEDDEFDAEF